MGPVVIVLGLSLVLGGAIGRWWAVPIAFALVVGFYVGLLADWWGHGVGDAWYFAMLLGLLLAMVGVLAGIAARKVLGPRLKA
jgi:hypothetical protein